MRGDAPLPLGQARAPAAWHRPRAHRAAPAATGGSRATMSTARSPRRRRSASASPRPRSRAIRGGDIPHDRMRLKIAENMVRAVSEAPHVTALFEADFSAIAAHKAALAAKGVKLSYTAYHRQGRGRGDGGRAGDQRALGRGPHRGLADDQHRRRHRAWRQGAGRAGGQGRRRAQPRGDRRASSTTSPRRARDGQADRRRRVGRQLHHFQPWRVGQPARRADHPPRRARRRSSASASSRSASSCARSTAQDAILIRPMAYVTLTIDHRVVDGHQTNAWLTPLRRDPRELAGRTEEAWRWMLGGPVDAGVDRRLAGRFLRAADGVPGRQRHAWRRAISTISASLLIFSVSALVFALLPLPLAASRLAAAGGGTC